MLYLQDASQGLSTHHICAGHHDCIGCGGDAVRCNACQNIKKMSISIGTNANECSAFVDIELYALITPFRIKYEKYTIKQKTFLGVCLVEKESGYDTQKLTNGLSSNRYGLFQISSKPKTGGCGRGYVGGICKIRCEGKAAHIICSFKPLF